MWRSSIIISKSYRAPRLPFLSKTKGKTSMTDQRPIRARSWLFTPATRPDRFAKAAAAGADVAILDLEDAVAANDKVQARADALDYLADNPPDRALHALRMNGLDTRAGISDLEA